MLLFYESRCEDPEHMVPDLTPKAIVSIISTIGSLIYFKYPAMLEVLNQK